MSVIETILALLQVLALAFIVIYALETLVLSVAIHRRFPTKTWEELPVISVVVAARNEERNIARCLESLVNLDYPKEKLDIIIADDRSSDRTADIIRDYAERFPFARYLAVQESDIKGKGNAIHQAVLIAKGEFILMTDADCAVQPTWAKETIKYFTDETGLVCGITTPRSSRLFERIQELNWTYLLSTGSAVAAIGYPIGGIGNNFSFRKSAYLEVGGYAKVRFSVTEDFALFQAIKKTKWKIAYPALRETQNITEPAQTVAELYKQQKRWILGGTSADWKSWITLLVGFGTHLLSALSFVIFPIKTALTMLAVKVGADALFLAAPLIRLRMTRLAPTFPFFELYQYILIIFVPISLLFDRKIVWKGRVYG
ncbi:MAG: glycosyltransferase [Chloroherpetonaceae bacterium]|nr:glycosyltransferase [Chloroherpetonaceae bacterium]MDW8436511.1 glycosyltransferase [Chloroherpetonaceae bacterium]